MKRIAFPPSPNLDALRFFAFLGVFISHAVYFLPPLVGGSWQAFAAKYLTNGDLGVSAFFVLSGFIITALLLVEKAGAGTVSIWKFYMRRILRIWPLYILIVLLGLVVIPHLIHIEPLTSPVTIHGGNPFWNLVTFTFNFRHGTDFLGWSVVLGVLWSISVEEQFYLVWPWVMKFFKRNAIVGIAIAVVIFAAVFRFIHADNRSIVEYSTFSVMSDIAIGSLLAIAYLQFQERIRNIRSSFRKLILWGSAAIIFADIVFRHALYQFHLFIALEPVFYAIAISGIIFVLMQERLASLFKNTFVAYLGKISYGLYMFHIISMIILRLLVPNSAVIEWIGAFVLTILIAAISYRFFESPLLLFKKHFENKKQ
ncbi:MAG: acyltransferase 3 [Patescibacteria group bacterium]|nr:acyltransferase 3 [Patescibacteria group bacterium]